MIYITNFDIFKGKKTIYHVDSIIRETGEKVENGLHEIYVNTKVDDGSTIEELMKCFKQTEVNHKKFPCLSERINYFKQDEEGVDNMCQIVDEYAEKYAKKAVKEAQMEAKIETIISLLKKGLLTLKDAAAELEISEEKLRETYLAS